MGLLSHQMLQIVRGVGPTPGDTSSAEQPLISIDLLDSGSGISLDLQDGWEPNIPSLKNGGLWADSPVSDGRTLIAGANTNVTETMRLIVSSQNAIVYAATFATLQRMIQDARAFWDSFYQIEPVYIAWWAAGAPGPQYSLIFNIDMDVNLEESEDAQATITLTIEREYRWRGVRPGGNPKEWNCYVNRVPFNSSNSNLRTGTQHTVTGTVNNKQQFNTVYTFLTNNFIDIPASRLPGDLPPLLCLAVKPDLSGSNNVVNLFLANSTKPVTLPDRSGNNQPRYNSFPAAGVSSLGTDATVVTDATLGIVHTPVSALARYASISFATATDQIRLTWATSATFANVSTHNLRGRYRVLLRGEQNGGALGDISLHLNMLNFAGDFFVSPTINPKITVANNVQLNDLGIVTLPSNGNNFAETLGRGASVDFGNFVIRLYASRSAGVGTLRVYDIILIPIDEGAVYLLPIATGGDSNTAMFYDNTGYFMHGKPDIYTSGRMGGDSEIPIESRGELKLSPGVNNRIYLLGENITAPIGSNPSMTFSIFANIVPCWSGIRDA